ERRGHGPRGPILPPEVPRWRSRAAEFDAAALEAFAEIDQHWHSQLIHLDLAVDMVPRMRLRTGAAWPEEVVAGGEGPHARRAPDPDDLRDLVYTVLIELVAQHLEISPDEVEAGPPGE